MRNINKFLLKFYHLENDIFFNQLFDTGEALITFNDTVTSPIWNHAFPYNLEKRKGEDRLLPYKEFIRNTVSFFVSKGRNPTIYLDEKYFSSPLLNLLFENKFERFDNEAWMRLKKIKKRAIHRKDLKMAKVDDESKLPDFKRVLNECFSSEYAIELSRDFGKEFGFKRIEHFCFYDEMNQLVGIGSVYYDKNTAHLHSVGVLPEKQRQGYGTVIVKEMYEYITKKLKIKDIVLQSDGMTVELFYKQLGAETFYRRYGYMLTIEK